MREGWVTANLTDVAEIAMGRQLSPDKVLGVRPLPYLRAANISERGIDLNDVLEMDFTESEEAKFATKVGDVLLVEGGNEKSVGTPALADSRHVGLCIQNTVIRCRTIDEARLQPGFLYQAMRARFLAGEFGELCTGTTIKHLGQKRVAALAIALPSLEEQRRIVDVIESVDNYIAALEKRAEAARTARSALLHDLLSNPGPDWVETSLDDLASNGVVTLGRGRVISKSDMQDEPGTYPVYSSAQHNNGRIGHYGKYMFDEELITWSVDGGGHLFYREPHRFSVTNIGGFIRVNDREIFNTHFLALALQQLHSQHVFDWQSKAHPSVIRKLYTRIPTPSVDEQIQIVVRFDSIDHAVILITECLANAGNLRAALLSDLLSGNHEIPASYDELLGAA